VQLARVACEKELQRARVEAAILADRLCASSDQLAARLGATAVLTLEMSSMFELPRPVSASTFSMCVLMICGN
jgi:hypothetical protein